METGRTANCSRLFEFFRVRSKCLQSKDSEEGPRPSAPFSGLNTSDQPQEDDPNPASTYPNRKLQADWLMLASFF